MTIALAATTPPFQAPPRPVLPPAYAAADRFAADFTALGATSVKATDSMTLDVTFARSIDQDKAFAIVNDTLNGAKLVLHAPMTAQAYIPPTIQDLRASVESLPEVGSTFAIDPVGPQPSVLRVSAKTAAGADKLGDFLRPQIGGYNVVIGVADGAPHS